MPHFLEVKASVNHCRRLVNRWNNPLQTLVRFAGEKEVLAKATTRIQVTLGRPGLTCTCNVARATRRPAPAEHAGEDARTLSPVSVKVTSLCPPPHRFKLLTRSGHSIISSCPQSHTNPYSEGCSPGLEQPVVRRFCPPSCTRHGLSDGEWVSEM